MYGLYDQLTKLPHLTQYVACPLRWLHHLPPSLLDVLHLCFEKKWCFPHLILTCLRLFCHQAHPFSAGSKPNDFWCHFYQQLWSWSLLIGSSLLQCYDFSFLLKITAHSFFLFALHFHFSWTLLDPPWAQTYYLRSSFELILILPVKFYLFLVMKQYTSNFPAQ